MLTWYSRFQVIVTDQNAGQVAKDVGNITSHSSKLEEKDISITANILAKVVKTNETSAQVGDHVLNTLNHVMDAKTEVLHKTQQKYNTSGKYVVLTSLLSSVRCCVPLIDTVFQFVCLFVCLSLSLCILSVSVRLVLFCLCSGFLFVRLFVCLFCLFVFIDALLSLCQSVSSFHWLAFM